jgi:hypothetical protein
MPVKLNILEGGQARRLLSTKGLFAVVARRNLRDFGFSSLMLTVIGCPSWGPPISVPLAGRTNMASPQGDRGRHGAEQ